jgi:N-alpha-acetyltransferase 15/16, NatA auxiliary subunit
VPSVPLSLILCNPNQKDAVSPGADLEEMQSLLYLTEEGNAHRRQGKLHHGLKKYHAVRKVSQL